jgi:hypothetical protein
MLNEGRGDELENILLNGGSGGSGGGIDTSKLTEIFPVTELTAVAEFDGVAPVMSPFTLTAGDIYLVDWNGTGYACEAKPVNFNNLPIVGIGNTIALGGENTGEPFAVGCIPEELTIHTNGAYGLVVPLDGSTTFKVGIYRIGKSAGTVLEDLPIALDFRNGNQTITADEGYLVKSAVIEKPSNLVPENIMSGVNIAGIDGSAVAGGGGGSLPFVMKTFTTPLANDGSILRSAEFTLLTAEELASINFDSSKKAFFFMVPTTNLTAPSSSYVTENFVCNYSISKNGSQDVYGRVAYVEKSGSSFKYTTRNATANPFSGTFDSSLGFVRYVNGAFVFKQVAMDGLYMYGSYFVMAGNLE